MSRKFFFAAAAALFASQSVACYQPDAPEEEDPNTTGVSQQQIKATTQAFTLTTSPAVALAAPFAQQQIASEAEEMGGSDGKAASKSLEDGSHELVTDPTCVTTSWANLQLSADFDNCVFAATGQTLDGGAFMGLSVTPLGAYVGFEQLSLDDASVDGDIGIYFAGTLEAPEVNIVADISVANAGTNSSASISNLDVAVDQSGLTASGTADILTAEVNADASFTAVHWDRGLCLPVSGTLDFTVDQADVSVAFLANTPYDGKAMVSVNGSAPYELQIAEPCPIPEQAE